MPDVSNRIFRAQEQQKTNHDLTAKDRHKNWRGHGNLMSGIDLDFKDRGTLLLQIT